VFPARRRISFVRERRDGLLVIGALWVRIRILGPSAATRSKLAVPAGLARVTVITAVLVTGVLVTGVLVTGVLVTGVLVTGVLVNGIVVTRVLVTAVRITRVLVSGPVWPAVSERAVSLILIGRRGGAVRAV
jgi:hypothetical protein